ncbi:uncharacterized protein LOC124888948 [Capsicum annuum]|uniref:uncharacterized protein LOC124888948 n=1 Tax=Capsicum annuum TaxID=4072 RepID=UPI001FB06C52|nr:uncharacterized protein LOC124888948 [Capsicum annuum]
MIHGFKHCRPVVMVDGAHLSGPYQGTFLCASTLDGAGMANHVITFLCASTLDGAGYEKWLRVHASINRGRMMTSNIAECINGCIVEARKLPILDFLEEVRKLFEAWNCKNREIASNTETTLGRRFDEILTSNGVKVSRMMVKPTSEYHYSFYKSRIIYVVDLDVNQCNCCRFQIDEIPCPHAIAVLKSKHITKFRPWCFDYYKPATLVKTYEVPIVPMLDKKDWHLPKCVEEEEVIPSKYKRPLGRLKKSRCKKTSENYHPVQTIVVNVVEKVIIDVLATSFQRRIDVLVT